MQSCAVQYLNTFYKILDDMEREMKEAELSNSISADFINRMIPHHQAAIKMPANLLRFNICRRLIPIADTIIVSRLEGIREMEDLLKEYSK